MDYTKIAKDILDHVGGTANVSELTHCFTRLRFVLKDQTKANKAVIEHLEGVITVVENAGQFQVVLGNKVEKVFDAMQPLLGDMQEQTDGYSSSGLTDKPAYYKVCGTFYTDYTSDCWLRYA